MEITHRVRRAAVLLGSLLAFVPHVAVAQQLISFPTGNQGLAVAVSPETLAIGRPHTSTPRVEIFGFDGASWVATQTLVPTASPIGGAWGSRLAIDGALLLVNTSYGTSGIPGRVEVFRDGGSSWAAEHVLAPADGTYYFGTELAIDEGRAIAAAIYAAPNDEGAVYVFTKPGPSWFQRQKIVKPSPSPVRIAFADSIAAGGGRIVITAPGDAQLGTEAGAAFVYRWNPGTMLYELEQKLVAADGVAGDRFGWDVDIDENRIVVSAIDAQTPTGEGAIYVFRHDGTSWVQEAKQIAPFAGNDTLSRPISIAGEWIHGGRGTGFDARLFAYQFDGAEWNVVATLAGGFGFGSQIDAAPGVLAATEGTRLAYLWSLSSCGDGAIEGEEECDDGGTASGDGCSAGCRVERCGNGIDDDGDSLVDLDDPGCIDLLDLSEVDPTACENGIDDDGDGAADLADVGCMDATDLSERDPTLPCDDGVDNDGDGAADYPAELVCMTAAFARENAECQDGLDNDHDSDGIDFDGGASRNGGVPLALPDPNCRTLPWDDREDNTGSCGLGVELAGVLVGWQIVRNRRKRLSHL
jgi:cysteine-rich repeat protein